jgi:beta-lactamase regulating signal transducer with metallopeptidase domain
VFFRGINIFISLRDLSQNNDNLIQIIQIFAQAIFFIHPLVYLLNKKINLYCEMACNDKTLRIGKSTRLEYSKCLTDIAERAVWTPTMWRSSSAFINQKSDLSHRIKYQMKEVTMSGITKKIFYFIR